MSRYVCSLLSTTTYPLIAFITSLLVSTPANAQSPLDLRASSERYRHAAAAFEQHVYRAGYFDHYEKRLAGRLEDVSCEFKAAAYNPNDVSGLLYHWDDLTTTHRRVEQSLVQGCDENDPALGLCWQSVAEAYECLREEMHCLSDRHGSGYHSHRPANNPPTFIPANPVQPQPYIVPQPGYSNGFGGFGGYGTQPSVGGGYLLPPQGVPALPFQPNWDPNANQSQPYRPQAYQPEDFGQPQGVQADPRAQIGAAIATTILNRLLNNR